MQPEDWHRRFTQQASWTRPAREYLFSVTGLPADSRILETGCGTGAVLTEVRGKFSSAVHGLDIEFGYLALAQQNVKSARLVCGDAYRLPYHSASFDACLCHFFLMWVDAVTVLAEMRRVARPGGWVLALAEPDYGGRIDYPEELSRIGRLQAESLRRQGADPNAGRRLAGLFHQAGLAEIRIGVIGGEWAGSLPPASLEDEWQVIRSDLRGILAPAELDRLHSLDEQSWRGGTRVLYVPVFYAAGRVPD